MNLVCGICCLALVLLLGCEPAPENGKPQTTPPNTLVPADDVIAARVAEATARLEASEAGRLILAAIEAHGGLTPWFANGPVFFRFNYRPLGRNPIDTYQLVDIWSSRAAHRLAADSSVGFGWSGEQAWRMPPEAELPTNARFWSLTPYYFIGIPFVFGDPGVLTATEGEMAFEGRTYDLVRVTYEAGTGDAPDDYYIVLVDRETRRVGGVRYVVSYPGFYPDGGHGAESLLVYDGAQTINGVTFPQTFRTFRWTDDGPGDLRTETTLSDVVFKPETTADAFEVPPGAEVLEGY